MGDHSTYLTQSTNVPEKIASRLSPEEIEFIWRYGAWYSALTQGKVVPTSDAQRHFIDASEKKVEAITPHELAWLSYKSAVREQLKKMKEETIDTDSYLRLGTSLRGTKDEIDSRGD